MAKKADVRKPGPPDVQIGPDCGSCGLFSDRLIGAGVGYCDQFKTWNWPHGRAWNCDHHVPVESLEGQVMRLEQALVWNKIAVDWRNGTNVGTPDDPQHASPTQQQIRAWRLAEGTGL